MDLPGNTTQSQSIAEAISQILSKGSSAALATLLETFGDSNAGAKLLIHDGETNQEPLGSLGNPALDREVIAHASKFLESKLDTRLFRVKEFAPELTAWAEVQVLFERIEPEPRLVICGAGHVGASLAKLASLMGYRSTLIDDRAEFLSRDRFPEPQIDLVTAGNWSDALRAAVGNGHGVSLAIVTRGHSEDEQCLRAVVDVNLDYVGLIGSKRRTNIVLQRVRDAGAREEKLVKVHAPVGLDIGAVTPEEVALAIMAEIVAVRRGGAGGSLSEWRRKSRN